MIITLFEHPRRAYTTQAGIIDTDWGNIAGYLQQFWQENNKEEVPMFNLWMFDPDGEEGRKYHYINGERQETFDHVPNTIRRCSDNAVGVWGLMLDYDGGRTIQQVQTDLEGFDYVLYTSHSHSQSKNKFRVVMPFTHMLTKEEFRAKEDSIKLTFPYVDDASFSESQAFFLHSAPNDTNAVAFRAEGVMLDPNIFPDRTTTATPLIQPTSNRPTSLQDVQKLLDDLKKHYMVLPYKTRFSISRAVAKDIGTTHALYEMRSRWTDVELNGKYENMLCDPLRADGPTLASVVHMIRQIDANYKRKLVNPINTILDKYRRK